MEREGAGEGGKPHTSYNGGYVLYFLYCTYDFRTDGSDPLAHVCARLFGEVQVSSTCLLSTDTNVLAPMIPSNG
jgi:hypothetical protein